MGQRWVYPAPNRPDLGAVIDDAAAEFYYKMGFKDSYGEKHFEKPDKDKDKNKK